MVQRTLMTTTHVAMMVAQEKTWSYVERWQWLHSPYYWGVWVSSFLFWFIVDQLCTNHCHPSSMVLFNPLDACFLLSTTHVHNLATCSSHIDSSTGCYTWSRFLISSTHHSQCTSITTWFVVNDNSFTLGLLCYHWLTFCSYESSLHKVFTWFLLIVCFCFFFGLCLLVSSFARYFWWMGSHPWFLFTQFFSPNLLVSFFNLGANTRP
jgi:hypothetical protein